jgi:HSP20 family protein
MANIDVKQTRPASVPFHDPWRSWWEEFERWSDQFAGPFRLPSMRRLFDLGSAIGPASAVEFSTPAVDISEDEKAYKITAELPGLEAKDIAVSVSGDSLVLTGEKQQEKEEKDKNYHMIERAYGSFQRGFMLPQGINRDGITAELSKGVLTITLPKTAEAQQPTKKIDVKSVT